MARGEVGGGQLGDQAHQGAEQETAPGDKKTIEMLIKSSYCRMGELWCSKK